MKKQTTVQDEKEIRKGRQKGELKGLACIAAGIFLLAAYAGLPTGFIGEFLREALRWGFGLGAFLFPVVFIAMGIGYFRMQKNLVRLGVFWAAMLFYVCLLGFLHHMLVPLDYEMEKTFLPEGGGLVGALVTKLLHSVFGATGSVIILIVGMLASLVLTGKLSLAALTAKAGNKIEDIRAARRERRQENRKELEEEPVPAGPRQLQRRPLFGNFSPEPENQGARDVYNDVYNNEEFSDYNEDVRKESVFKQILKFGNKKGENDPEDSGFNDPWPDREKETLDATVERMANHKPAEKERPPLTAVYPEKQQTVVLRPASGIIKGHRDDPEPAPWEKDAMVPETDPYDIPISHYGEAEGEKSPAGDEADERPESFADASGKPRYVLTPNGMTPAANQTVKAAAVSSEKSESTEKAEDAVNAEPADKAVEAVKEESLEKTREADKAEAADNVNGDAAVHSGNQNIAEEQPEIPVKPEYKFPPLELLNPVEIMDQHQFDADVREQCRTLEQTLKDFKVNARVTGVTRGPSVTRYELEPAAGVKVSSVVNLADDIALRLAAPGVRVEAPIPGKAAIGIEAPNITNDMVGFREIVDCKAVRDNPSKLCVGLGKDIEGKVITIDLSKMPHLLVAGTTGSGKSVCVNTLLAGIMYKARPDEVKLILVDPKVVELTNYNGIPHLLVPVVTDAKKAASALHWAVAEMERRYKSFADTRVRDIKAYNAQAAEKMPYIVIVIDEMSDLMMVAKADVEDAILRLAQKARACGIHMVLATQRPSVDVITGIVKANIPSRIAFAVSSLTDSRTILDMGGAEKLLGKGDMLFYPIGANKPLRVQGAFVSDEELNRVTEFIKQQAIPVEYSDDVTNVALPSDSHKEEKAAAGGTGEPAEDDGQDELLDEAIRLVLDLGQASSSMLQRRFRIGYNRAARLVDAMEELGIVGPAVGSKPRELRMSREEVERIFLSKDAGESQEPSGTD